MIYGHPVCKKCYYRFANRRQLGFLVDTLLLAGILVAVFVPLYRYVLPWGTKGISAELLTSALAAPMLCLFVCKDGLGGQSPGKWLCGLKTLNDESGRPISFGQSFKRNSVFLFRLIPLLGSIVDLIVTIVIAVQVGKGYRLGDRFAKTRVIWNRFATAPVFGGNALACENCGYDLTGNTSGICPECGASISQRNAELLAARQTSVTNLPTP
jgi:uncharacterized RDD family membrane protein YckC